jgi:carbamoylphosphate synthase small subunit
MKNLNEMTTTELKKLAKDQKVKNWWNLTKADLIKALTPAEPAKKSKKDKTPKKTKIITDDNLITLKEICADAGVKGSKARRLLREHATSEYQKYNRWEWDRTDKDTIAAIKAIILGTETKK